MDELEKLINEYPWQKCSSNTCACMGCYSSSLYQLASRLKVTDIESFRLLIAEQIKSRVCIVKPEIELEKQLRIALERIKDNV